MSRQGAERNVRTAFTVPPYDLLSAPLFDFKYTIRLTARESFVQGRAALVFVSPHVHSPADDVAVYGESQFDGGEVGIEYSPPHEGARLVAWSLPPNAGGKYNIDFEIVAAPGSYSLEGPEGVITTQVPGLLHVDRHVATTFQPYSNDWFSFSLFGDDVLDARLLRYQPAPVIHDSPRWDSEARTGRRPETRTSGTSQRSPVILLPVPKLAYECQRLQATFASTDPLDQLLVGPDTLINGASSRNKAALFSLTGQRPRTRPLPDDRRSLRLRTDPQLHQPSPSRRTAST